jgi:hypothetical protein
MENGSLPARLILNTETGSDSTQVIKETKLLRREHIMKLKKEYTIENNVGPTEEIMEEFAKVARDIYPLEGRYLIENDTITWVKPY